MAAGTAVGIAPFGLQQAVRKMQTSPLDTLQNRKAIGGEGARCLGLACEHILHGLTEFDYSGGCGVVILQEQVGVLTVGAAMGGNAVGQDTCVIYQRA